MVLAAFVASFATIPSALAQEPSMNAAALAHAVDRLAVTARVLYIAAHPDDENTRLLAWLVGARHLDVAYLSMTRGGGGQNLIGREQDALLDVLRTEELLAARRLDGGTQRFTRMRDFGYSKTAAETLDIWGHDEALSDVVRVIRTFQPDVILARFDEKPPNHGHHTASATLAREAFRAAADASRFPEQLQGGVEVWQANRLLLNVPTWREEPPPADALVLDVGTYDARLGLSYGELAAMSRSQHKSQGFGTIGERGPILERFTPVAGTRPKSDIMEGIETGWSRFGPAATGLADALAEARVTLDRDAPERALPALLRAHRALAALPDGPRVRDARIALDRVIAAALGLFVRTTSPLAAVVPGSGFDVKTEIVLRRPASVQLRRITIQPGVSVDDATPLEVGVKREVSSRVTIPIDAAVSAPYWLAAASLPGRQVVSDARLIGEPKGPSPLTAVIEISVEDRVLRLEAPVVHAWLDSVLGERTRTTLVVPPATVTPLRQAVLAVNGAETEVVLRVVAGSDATSGDVVIDAPEGWSIEPSRVAVSLAKAGDSSTVRFLARPGAAATSTAIAPAFESDGRRWSWREDILDHPHVPLQVVLQPASLRLVPLTIELPAGKVGYLPGPGDSVAEDLAHVGVHVETISDETLRSGDLGSFSAIVTGVRAFNTSAALRAAHARLQSWMESGGTLVVQYVTNNRLAPVDFPIGPYPFVVGRGRITDENAAMTPVDPAHSLLHEPNPIDEADFEGWVQERGLYYAETWDDRYQPLLRSADPGEEPLSGGVLTAKVGRGRYVYTGLAFFRQLPAGVPGAYRLLANLISSPRP